MSDAELKSYVALAGKVAGESNDFYVGLNETLGSMLSAPYFLFRVERAKGPASGGVLKVDDDTKASRLSFMFWNAPPDEALLAAVWCRVRRQTDAELALPRAPGEASGQMVDVPNGGRWGRAE